MLSRGRRIAAMLVLSGLLAGCSGVLNPISPQDARTEVIDVGKQVVTDLGAEIAEAKFGYKSCSDLGNPPFRAHGYLLLWMPGADRSREVPPETVLDRLRQRGWQTDPDFHSHATTFKRDGVDVSVFVIPPSTLDEPLLGHLSVDLFGECRDTFDHRNDHTNRLHEDIRDQLRLG